MVRSDLQSKADRKFEKKIQFYSKVKDAVTSLNATKSIAKKKLRPHQRKLRTYDLSLLSESLPELKPPKQQPVRKFKLNCKTRNELVANETMRLEQVLSDPSYQKDPQGYILQHLEKAWPINKAKTKNNNSEGKGKKKKKKKKKNKEGGETETKGTPVSMDI